MKNIILRCQKGAEEKTGKYFDYHLVGSFANAALNYLLYNSNRYRVTSFFPNVSSSFCNKFPKSGVSSVYNPSSPKVNILAGDKLVSIIGLEMKNGLYDTLTVIRDEYGAFAYRSQMICSLSNIEHILKGHQDVEGKSESTHTSLGAPSCGAPIPIEPLAKNICTRPISKIPSTEDESAVIFSYKDNSIGLKGNGRRFKGKH